MFSEKVIEAYEKAFVLSNPPTTINKGTEHEHQVFVGKKGESQHQLRQRRERHLANKDWSEDVWFVCQPDAELANAVMDYASSLVA